MASTTLKELFAERGVSLSYALTGTSSARVARTFAEAGYDFVMIDLEHGSDRPEIIDPCIEAVEEAGSFAVLKTRSQRREDLQIAYDFAPSAVEVPGISSVSDAKAAVEIFAELSKNPPRRGESRDPAFIALIESKSGIDAIEQIVAIPGVHAVEIGMFDLSRDLGIEGQVNHPLVYELYERVLSVARSTGVRVGIGDPSAGKEQFDIWRQNGNGLELGVIDLQSLRRSAEEGLAIVKSSGRR